MIKASARPKYDTAILGAEYDSDTARFLADRLRARLSESRCVWVRDPSMADADGTTADNTCATARKRRRSLLQTLSTVSVCVAQS